MLHPYSALLSLENKINTSWFFLANVRKTEISHFCRHLKCSSGVLPYLWDVATHWHDLGRHTCLYKLQHSSAILQWKKFGTTTTLPRAGRLAKWSNLGRRVLETGITKNSMVTPGWETPPEGQHHCSTPLIWTWRKSGQTEACPQGETTKGLRQYETRFSPVWWNQELNWTKVNVIFH